MNITYPLASVGELIGEPARAAILIALLEGRALTAGELALIAGVSPQSASAHLSKLVDGGLLSVQPGGRHRYYKLAGAEIARALEALGAISTRPRHPVPLHSPDADAMRAARSCYDHLAGRVAVELTASLESEKVIRSLGEREYDLGPRGRKWFADFGVDTDAARRSRRGFALKCLDWTERRPHIAGALGAALCSRLLALGWLAQRRNSRVLRITHRGARELNSRFGLAA
jgi:DNA-binding transcriptional ArsR family regulator